MKITEKDAEILDYIVGESLKSNCLRAYDLRPLNNRPLSKSEDVKESAYRYYFDILKERNVVKVSDGVLTPRTEIHRIDDKTEEFLRQGGFKKEVQDELNAIEKAENIEKLKTKNLVLQNENLEFAQTIRKQEATIRKLDIFAKIIDFLKAVKWVIGFLIGILLYLLLS